jgi:uncharacterized protein (TIGR02246 family)
MKRPIYILIAGVSLAALMLGLVADSDRVLGQTAQPSEPKDTGRTADEEAVRKSMSDLASALEKGDAKAIGGFWTEEGEYIGGDGSSLRGKAAIEEAYANHFAKDPKAKVDLKIDSIRFVSHDSAIVEGHASKQKGKGDQPTSNKFSVLRVREDGHWLIALLREWPDEGVTPRDMEWLIGTWTAKTDGGDIRTTYEWDETKKFIRCRFEIKTKENTLAGTQIIGRNPRTGNLRSWLFESDGGIGEAEWNWDGKRWVQDATGVQEDGDEFTATNILTPLDKDSFTWQSINRTENGEDVPNIPPIKVTRIK